MSRIMLHSLNTLRVMAEFWVVRLHLLGLTGGHASAIGLDIFTHDLLSFFFVLSGFVAGHSHVTTERMDWADSKRYWLTRWAKTYPVYFVWVTVNLVGILSRETTALSCSWFWPCVIGDYLLLSPWMFCESIEGPGVAWYLTTLYWLWLAFPFVHSRGGWLRGNPWTSVGMLYALSLPPWTLGLLYPSIAGGGTPTNNLSRVPLFRLCEFLMGYCAAFSSGQMAHIWPVAGITLCVGQYAMDAVTTSGYTACIAVEGASTCYLWGDRDPPVQSCIPRWDQYWSRTSLVWTALIAYCADSEPRWEGGIPGLNYTFWRTMSSFSLQMYLGHFSIGAVLVRLTQLLGVPGFWQVDTLLMACYFLNYCFHRHVQPIMDRAARRLCRLDSVEECEHTPALVNSNEPVLSNC